MSWEIGSGAALLTHAALVATALVSYHHRNRPLADAADWRDVAQVRRLLLRGASVKVRGPATGWTPLMVAVDAGGPALVRLCLDRGADVNARARGGTSVLWLLHTNPTPEIWRDLRGSEPVCGVTVRSCLSWPQGMTTGHWSGLSQRGAWM